MSLDGETQNLQLHRLARGYMVLSEDTLLIVKFMTSEALSGYGVMVIISTGNDVHSRLDASFPLKHAARKQRVVRDISMRRQVFLAYGYT
jgi:hypothetical protein